MRPVIVEAAINEGAMRDANPHVPFTPDECASDGIECRDAGATLVHWHARDPLSGRPAPGATAEYAPAQDRYAAAGVLSYPTYPNQPVDDVDARMAHCLALADRHGLEMAPIDLGAAQQTHWDGAALNGSGTLANPAAFIAGAAARFGARNLLINLSSFDLGSTRLAVRLAQTGVLAPPLILKFYLSDSWMVGPEPSEAAIDLHVAQIPPGIDVDWILVPFRLRDRARVERLCRYALARGGGVRVGLGDNDAVYPRHRNAELVAQAVEWARDAGQTVATADDLRKRAIL